MSKKNLSRFILLSLLVFAISSCSNPKSSVEYKSLEAEIEALNSQIQNLESSIEQRSMDEERITTLNAKREQLIGQFDAIFSDPIRRQSIASKLGIDACKVRVDKQNDALAIVDLTDDFSTSSAWYVETDKGARPGNLILGTDSFSAEDYPQSLADYSAILAASRCRINAENEFYKTCETVDKKLINKNPEAFKGKCIKGTVRIAQFDSNTGPCAFQGYLGGGYDVRAQFGLTMNPDTQDELKECSWTKDLVEDNFITFWGYGLGAYTYTTSNGGSQTIPAFKMVAFRKG